MVSSVVGMTTGFSIADRVPVEPNLILAPMAGVTDSPFRRLIKELGGVGLIVTEFAVGCKTRLGCRLLTALEASSSGFD